MTTISYANKAVVNAGKYVIFSWVAGLLQVDLRPRTRMYLFFNHLLYKEFCMQVVTRLSLVFALVAIVSCGEDGEEKKKNNGDVDANQTPTTFSLSLELNGYGNAHDGHTLYFSLWDDADDMDPVATMTKDVVKGGGGNTIELADKLTEGKSYTLYWFADVNENETCDMDTDHHWNLKIDAVKADAALVHQHTAMFDGDCSKH